eukprot:SAG22_NODE_1041_length_5885_cov_9.278776_3_plen_49_part_00
MCHVAAQSKAVVLTAEELSAAVAQNGVTFKKPKFYADDAEAVAEGMKK